MLVSLQLGCINPTLSEVHPLCLTGFIVFGLLFQIILVKKNGEGINIVEFSVHDSHAFIHFLLLCSYVFLSVCVLPGF